MPPNFDRDDENPPGCTRGDWGPNFCTCGHCSEERAQQQRASKAVADECRRQGRDPDQQVMPLFIAVDEATHDGLVQLARMSGHDPEHVAYELLRNFVEIGRKRGRIR